MSDNPQILRTVALYFDDQRCETSAEVLRESADEIERLEKELELTDKILADRKQITDLLDCPVHGDCVPYAIDEIKRLQAIAGKLPKTADGVAYVPGMDLYVIGDDIFYPKKIIRRFHSFDCLTTRGIAVLREGLQPHFYSPEGIAYSSDIFRIDVSTSYSTREAAEAAMKEQTETKGE